MWTSRERILTSHVGSLPRPDALIDTNRARAAAEAADEAHFQTQLRAAVERGAHLRGAQPDIDGDLCRSFAPPSPAIRQAQAFGGARPRSGR